LRMQSMRALSTIDFAKRTPFRSCHGLRIRTIDIALLWDIDKTVEAALSLFEKCFNRKKKEMTFVSNPCRVSLKDVKTSDRDVSGNVSEGNPGNKSCL